MLKLCCQVSLCDESGPVALNAGQTTLHVTDGEKNPWEFLQEFLLLQIADSKILAGSSLNVNSLGILKEGRT